MRSRKWWRFIAGLGAVGGVRVPLPPKDPEAVRPREVPPGRFPDRPGGGPPPGHPEKWDSTVELSAEEIEIWRHLI
ncbi:hypothetical protein J7F03_04735 [Streptomyces sp. ISL-43]|uniref:DUF6059 family protein n=1 Tax=Streptomyces sp. ISL-43 TaxID=2819183 RepID=UPI001BE83F35|nr:DUF6059 family protein [Streptomyces sp. ISL-43]MBT2446400.1 hypothetical protein [Streptomyces sp. ISL-43]